MAVSGVNGSNGNQNLSAADLKTIEELEKEIKEDKERLKGLKKNREDMVEGSSRDNVDKAIKDLEKTIKNKEERLKALKAGETPTPNGDAGKTDGFDGAGIGEEEGLKNFIEQQGDTSTYGLAKSLSSFFKKVTDFFEPNALDTTTTDDTTTDETDDASAIVGRGTVSLTTLNDIIDKNVPNGTAREKRVYVTERINELNKELSAPVKTRNSEDIKTLISAYESILKDIDKEIFAEKLKEQQDRLKDAGNAGRLAGKAGIALDTPTIEDKTVDADELSKRINDNAERAFSIAENAEKQEAIAKLKAEIDKNVPNGTLEEKQNYILNQINMLDSKITTPGVLASKSDSISLRSSYIEIYNENAKELGTEEFGAIKMADVSSLKSILDNMETVDPDELNKRINDNIERDFSVVEDNTTVDADELNKRINDNIERDFSVVEDNTTVDADELNKRINDNIERDFSIATDDIAKIAKFEEEIGNLKSELSGRGSGLGYLKFRLSNAEANYAKATDETKKAEYQKEIDTLKADIERLETEQLKTQAKLEAKEKEYAEYNRNLAQSNVNNNNNDSVGTYVDITPEERAELDKMNEGSNNIIEYAKLTDQEISSKMNEINSQMAGLQAEADELENKYRNGEISISEYNAQLDAIDAKDYALYEELMNVQSAITYKNEEKVIETMTDSQKAELESVNNKMIPLQEQVYAIRLRQVEVVDKLNKLEMSYQDGEITEEQYNAEVDKLVAQEDELQSIVENIFKELDPLQAQRDEIFANAGKSDTPDIPVTPTTGGTTSTDNLTEDEKKALERLKEVANGLQNVGSGVLGGTSSGITLDTPITQTTSGTTTSTTWTTTTNSNFTTSKVGSKPKSNIFTKAADKVTSDDVEGVIDALNAKGITNTYTNARKVADAADVDITRSKYNKAMSGSGVTEEVVDPDGAEFKFKKKLDDDNRQGFSMKF